MTPLHLLGGTMLLASTTITATTVALWIAERRRGWQRARAVETLAAEAATDPLTGLGNRRGLASAVERAVAAAPALLHLLTVDLDGLGEVGAGLGHEVGDGILVAVAHRLRLECGPVGGETFRLDGDEFGVLLTGSDDEARDLADRLVDALPAAVATAPGAAAVRVVANVGIARHATGPAPAGPDAVRVAMADLRHSADAARAARSAGGGRVMSWGGPLAQRRAHRFTVLQALRRKMDDGGPEVHLQPVVDLRTMTLRGAEALASWHDPDLGRVPSEEFVRIAEEHGLMTELGRQLLRRSMVAAVTGGASGAGLFTAVVLSAAQLRSPGFPARVGALLDEFGIDPQTFVAEIGGSAVIDEDDPAHRAVLGLADLGIPLAMDDFGTGDAALGALGRLPLAFLKLDRALTAGSGTPKGRAVAESVIGLARTLGIDVIAEGIETTGDLAAMQELGVRHGQGWLFSRPVPAARMAEFVADPSSLFAGHPDLADAGRIVLPVQHDVPRAGGPGVGWPLTRAAGR